MDKRHQICQKLLAITRQRIAETLSCIPEDLPELSLGRAINLLWHLVTTPTETAEELFAAATKVVDAVCPQQKKACRHEMEAE